MLRFAYEVRQSNGEIQRGLMEAESAQTVERHLIAQGYEILSLHPVVTPVAARPWEPFTRRVLAPILYPVSSKMLAQFFVSLRVLLSAGMTLAEAMLTLSRQSRNPTLKRAARQIAEAAARGRPMSSILRRYPAAFSPATMAAIDAAEESGMMELTADRLSKYYDRTYQLELTYRWQTFYTKILLVAALVLPTVPTLVLQGPALWFAELWHRALPWLLAIIAVWYGWRVLVRIPVLSQGIDRLKLLLPWFGSLARRMGTARWARALSMLSAAGVPVHRALVAAAAACGNKAMEASLLREADGVLRGRTLAEVARASREIPEAALDLLAISERSGSTEDVLDKVAEYYESETEVGGKQTATAVGVLAYLAIAFYIAMIVIQWWGAHLQGVSGMIDGAGGGR